ncbi:MAG: poly(R)-hydroxyalkanoic acid synthase subunit PhaE [Deltaproteobacteria bacterium]
MSKEAFDYTEHYKKFYEAWEKTMSEAMDMWKKNPLVNSNSKDEDQDYDPAELYKKFYETWEKSSSEVVEKWVNSPLFAANVGKAIEKSSEFKKHFDEAVEKTLKNMRFPTKSDMDRMLTSINKLEEKINDLVDKVDDLSKPARRSKK